MQAGYNGWANRETWNVALWIGNDEGLYRLALDCADYSDFKARVGTFTTPDGVWWGSAKIDTAAIDELIREGRDG